MRHPDVTPVKRKHEVADLYGAVTLVDRGDGYFYLKQPIPEDDPVEQDSIVAFSRKTMEELHAKIGEWLATPVSDSGGAT